MKKNISDLALFQSCVCAYVGVEKMKIIMEHYEDMKEQIECGVIQDLEEENE